MDFLLLEKKERQIVIEQAAIQLGISPVIVEKDFWIVFVLKLLFSESEYQDHLIFKGGTSLSKCYHIIERFSEDVDLTIKKMIFDCYVDDSELKSFGSSKRKKYLKQLNEETIKYVNNIVGFLKIELKTSLNISDTWTLEVEESDLQTVFFYYPKSLESKIYGEGDYIKPRIILEFGSRGGIKPTSAIKIQPLIGTHFKKFEQHVPVIALDYQRTFWEKVTAIHSYLNKKSLTKANREFSRHFYDVYKLIKKDTFDLNILYEVIEDKIMYFRDKQAQYEKIKQGELILIPDGQQRKEIEQDYQKMEIMIHDKKKPSLEEILIQFQVFQVKTNKLLLNP